MKKVMEYKTHIKPWGKTSGDVLQEVQSLLFGLNSPAPFESEPSPIYMDSVYNCVKEICDTATKSRRKGMMISSRFTVELITNEIVIHHVRNEYPSRQFMTISKV